MASDVTFGEVRDMAVDLARDAENQTKTVLEGLETGASDIGLADLTKAGIELDIASTTTATAQKAWTNMNNQAQKVTQ
jgi:hypothetical protein